MKGSIPCAVCVIVACASLLRADIPLKATRVASGLTKPLFVTSAPGDPNRLFIVEQQGTGSQTSEARIKIFDYTTGTVNATPFLTVTGLDTTNLHGVLGMAFHPDYATNGKFYLQLTAAGQVQVRQYTRSDANTANAGSGTTILTRTHPQVHHNGGWIGFGPNDGYLYITSGDGGNANDIGPGHTEPGGNAQDITSNFMGKILRIDVNSDGFPSDPNKNYAIPAGNPFAGAITGDDEIWHYGLRNPWRASFDRANGDLYIADVGEGAKEEVDVQPDGVGGLNFGWRAYEGTTPRPGNTDPLPTNHTPPIHEYTHPGGNARSITGGYVYRGDENAALQGTYFFGDFISGQVWSFKYDRDTLMKTKFRELTGTIPTNTGTINSISSFGEDAQGRLYIVDHGGEVFRLVVPTPGDANFDGMVTVADLGDLASNWQRTGDALWAHGDFNDDGNVTISDLGELASHWQEGVAGMSLQEAMAALGLTNVPEPSVLFLSILAWSLKRPGRLPRARLRAGSPAGLFPGRMCIRG